MADARPAVATWARYLGALALQRGRECGQAVSAQTEQPVHDLARPGGADERAVHGHRAGEALRRGAGQQSWYLLTNVPVADPQELWRVVLAYARRWQLEMVWRYGKSEIAME